MRVCHRFNGYFKLGCQFYTNHDKWLNIFIIKPSPLWNNQSYATIGFLHPKRERGRDFQQKKMDADERNVIENNKIAPSIYNPKAREPAKNDRLPLSWELTSDQNISQNYTIMQLCWNNPPNHYSCASSQRKERSFKTYVKRGRLNWLEEIRETSAKYGV